MARMMPALAVAAAIGSIFLSALEVRAQSCPSGKTHVAKWGCVATKEITQAKKNCEKVGKALGKKVPFTECLCQDGASIGACGD